MVHRRALETAGVVVTAWLREFRPERIVTGGAVPFSERRKRLEEPLLPFDADAGRVRNPHPSALDGNVVRKASERLKDVRIGFVAVQCQARGDVQGELVASVWNALAR